MSWKCKIGIHDWQYEGFTVDFKPYGRVTFYSQRRCSLCGKRNTVSGMHVQSRKNSTIMKSPGNSTILSKPDSPIAGYSPGYWDDFDS